ncbi:hypothetical protein [Cedratvirus kamchatka]|uniref:Uncharacterized protein n=1 Tax=Cedratvirus kamchatka TaxID=2716914 RepID=A0A6G8MXG8_9VIRU|nr:hypothetical protein [Cedratvirus kamchatka]
MFYSGLNRNILELVFEETGMRDRINIFIKFRSVNKDFLDLAHHVGGPIKAEYKILEALSYYRLLPATSLLYYPPSVTLTKKVRRVDLSTSNRNLHVKGDHLHHLSVLVSNVHNIKVELDLVSVENLYIHGEKVFFPLTFPVKNLELSCTCDACFLNLDQTESLTIKYYSDLTGKWPIFPCLKYLTEQTVRKADLYAANFPNLRRMTLVKNDNREIFPGELFLVHSLASLSSLCQRETCADLYLVTNLNHVPSKENVIYRVSKVEEQDLLLLNKNTIRFFSNVEISPEVKRILKLLCGQAKIHLRGQIRVW